MILRLMLVLTATCWLADGARILAFLPFPTKSHQKFIQPLVRELAVRGHQVVCYTAYPTIDDPPANLTIVKVPDYTDILVKGFDMGSNQTWDLLTKYSGNYWSAFLSVFHRQMGIDFLDWILQKEIIQNLFKSDEKFDLVLVEASFLQEPFIALGHKFKAPIISYFTASSYLWTHFVHGSPYDTSYIAECLFDLTDRMDFPDRLFNTVSNMWLRLVGSFYFNPISQGLMDKYIRYPGWEERPSISDMLARASLVLANTHVAINYPYPYSPHFIGVGGLNLLPPKPLPKDLQVFMDDAKDGVIYFTLGSMVNVSSFLGKRLSPTLVNVFGKLKQKVLMKWEMDFPNLPKNVKIGKWFPQQDILSHKNCVLFITHGGMLSLTETVYHGVPTVGIPLLADQMANVRHMEHFGYGIRLSLSNVTEESLSWAINQIMTNPKYSENAKKRSAIFRDKPETALETAVYWTEYVLRHKGAEHLRPAIATMPWYQQAMIDVYLTLAIIILIPVYIIYKSTKCICTCLCGRKNSKKTKKE